MKYLGGKGEVISLLKSWGLHEKMQSVLSPETEKRDDMVPHRAFCSLGLLTEDNKTHEKKIEEKNYHG